MSQRRPFTPEEDVVIIRRYSLETFTAIGARLGRPWGIVQQRIAILVKAGRINPRKRFWQPRWTEHEVELLENLRGRVSDAELARRLGRSEMAVFLKGKRIGKVRKDDFLTANQVGAILGIDPKRVVWLQERGVLRLMRSAVRAGSNVAWRCELEELERFLRRETAWYDWHRIEDPVYREIGREANRDPWLTAGQAARIAGFADGGCLGRYLVSGELASVKVPSGGKPGYSYRIRRSALSGFRPKRPELLGHVGRGKRRAA